MIAIIDYGAGNLRSAQKAFEHLGCAAVVTSDPDVIARSPGVVLPGQGAFGSCMAGLQAAGLVAPTLAAIRSGRPFLGICVGMQLLFEESEEAPGVRGLGVFGGKIVRFPHHPTRKVPQMGWNQLQIVQRHPVLEGIPDGAYVYFVHSYYPVPTDPTVAATRTSYGVDYVSSVARDNVWAGVFHPEKSQQVGLRLLGNFVELVREGGVILYPAIDLRDGHCVRLTEGDFAQETVYGDDPVAMARRWVAAGAQWLHVVDLDGARAGRPVQLDLVRAICAAVPVPVQVGGGLRDADNVAQVLDAGVRRAIVGTLAARDPERCRTICQRWPGRVAAGIDARDGLVRVAGWLEGEAMLATDLARHVAAMGAAAIIFTDIARDGTQHGVNVDATAAVARAAGGVPVIASGGIGTVAHLRDVAQIAADGVGGVIVGRALYTGAVTIQDALAAVEAA